jgi:glycosyltransferase involved in cell wall biosynthesis
MIRTKKRTTPYRFLFVSAPFSGIEVFFRNLHNVLADRDDIDSTWEWIEFEPHEFLARVPPLSWNWTLKGGLVSRWRVRRLERERTRYSAALFNHMLPLFFLRDFQRRIPTILSIDTTPRMVDAFGPWYAGWHSPFRPFLHNMKRRFDRGVYMDCARILPWTDLVRHSLEQHYGVPPNRITVLSPGVDIEHWKCHRKARGNEKKMINVLFVGGQFWRKGGDLLVQVSKRDEFKRCVFHIVTREHIDAFGDNLHIHVDMDPNNESLKQLFAEADVFVLPTKADFAPTNAICEAMAMGLPVITTYVGGLEEVVRDGDNGFVIPPDDVESLALRLRILVDSEEKRMNMGRKGRKLVEEHYNIALNAEKIIDLMCEAADGNLR